MTHSSSSAGMLHAIPKVMQHLMADSVASRFTCPRGFRLAAWGAPAATRRSSPAQNSGRRTPRCCSFCLRSVLMCALLRRVALASTLFELCCGVALHLTTATTVATTPVFLSVLSLLQFTPTPTWRVLISREGQYDNENKHPY